MQIKCQNIINNLPALKFLLGYMWPDQPNYNTTDGVIVDLPFFTHTTENYGVHFFIFEFFQINCVVLSIRTPTMVDNLKKTLKDEIESRAKKEM